MPNNYFRFKEFMVRQEKCSMKVCTDACLFGAYIAGTISNDPPQIGPLDCLDIGSGTGLLSLMLAQKMPGIKIDAVEIEKNAYEQAEENFSNSKWSDRLRIFHTDIKDFVPGKKYHLIISNPPFYENELQSEKKNNNIAKHDAGLLLKELIPIIKTHLTESGSFAVMLPYHRANYFENLAREHKLFLQHKLSVQQTPTHDFFRAILSFSCTETEPGRKEMIIKNPGGDYTEKFKDLLKDYYLKL